MKTTLLYTFLVLVLVSCSSKKQIEKSLHSGNYDQAIETALQKLEINKDKERKQDFVVMLEAAFYKAVERDLNDIEHLKKDGNPQNFKTIYNIYMDLDARQEAIKPALPLQLNGKFLQLPFNDYSDNILTSRNSLVEHLYTEGSNMLKSTDKEVIRDAYDALTYIEQIYPNYKNTRNLINESHERGSEYVLVTIENQTEQIIPRRLEEDLLNFDTYGLNQFWIVYHANADPSINYDFAMKLQLTQINISAEELREKQVLKEKQIVDGWKYQLDTHGNVAKDSLGNDIKVDNILTVRARYFEYNQFKSSQLIANVIYIDLKNNNTLERFPIQSEFVFENKYALMTGDKRALESNEITLLKQSEIYFPTDAQMVFDTGEDLKARLKIIISSYLLKT